MTLKNTRDNCGHVALYAVMIGAPGTGVNTEFFFLFDLPKFESTALCRTVVAEGMGLDFKTFEKPIDFIHKDVPGAWLVWLLIAGHAAAAPDLRLIHIRRTTGEPP